RTAPDLYLGVQPVTRDSEGRLSIGGGGEAVDWVVCMARFDGDALFDRLASRHELRVEWMVELARAVRRLHEAAEPRPSYGGRKGLSWVIDGNLSSLRDAEIFEASA